MSYNATTNGLLTTNGIYRLPKGENLVSGDYDYPYMDVNDSPTLATYVNADGSLAVPTGTRLFTLPNGNYAAFLGSSSAGSARLAFYKSDDTQITGVVDIALGRYNWHSEKYYLFIYADDSNNTYWCSNNCYVEHIYNNVTYYYVQVGVNRIDLTEWIDGSVAPPEYHNGAGSGYIGNALLSNKKMVGFNVPISDVEGTKTESVEVHSATPTADTPKAGNGFAKITWLRDLQT